MPLLHHSLSLLLLSPQTKSPSPVISSLLFSSTAQTKITKYTMKRKNKGKVYPSPSSSSSTPSPPVPADADVLSVLNLLPAAILALASILSLQDREVLAYMITRSIETTTLPTPSTFPQDSKKKPTKKLPPNKPHSSSDKHKAPVFYCDCFDCYRSYWFRWDSSPNRELIHQVIEAFEDHLSNGEHSSATRKSARGKRKDKTGRRGSERPDVDVPVQPELLVLDSAPPLETRESSPSPPSSVFGLDIASNDDVASPAASPVSMADGGCEEVGIVRSETKEEVAEADAERTAVVLRIHGGVSNHKGLARKVLPDVLGLLNSRLWSLWSPNV